MGRGLSHRNIAAVKAAIHAVGGELISVANGSNHFKIHARTSAGADAHFTISYAPVDAHKYVGWVRQALRRADSGLLR